MDGLTLRDRRPTGDVGDAVLGWLTRVSVTLAMVAMVAFDVISISVAGLSAEDDASSAARHASAAYSQTGSIQAAYDAAVAAAVEAHRLNQVPTTSFRVGPDGTVTLDVQRTATTLLVSRIGWIDQWAEVTREATGQETP